MKILICETIGVYRESLKKSAQQINNITFFAEAADGNFATMLVNQISFDLVLLDFSIPGVNSIKLLKFIQKNSPSTKVIMMSLCAQKQLALRALLNGASGYITKEIDADDLKIAVNSVMEGRKYISKLVADSFAQQFNTNYDWLQSNNLLPNEFEVLIRLANGNTVQAIARELLLTVDNINNIRHMIESKIANNRKSILLNDVANIA